MLKSLEHDLEYKLLFFGLSYDPFHKSWEASWMSVKCVSIWSCSTCYLNVGVLPGNWGTYQKLIRGKYILKIKRANVYILFKCFTPL